MSDYTNKVNGKAFTLKETSPSRLKRLDDISEMLAEWNEENEGFYLYDVEFRAKLLKKITDVIFEWKDGQPDEDFFSDDDLEVSQIVKARSVFLARAGVI